MTRNQRTLPLAGGWIRAGLGLGLGLLIVGCSGVKDTAEPPTPLEDIESPQVQPEVVWEESAGDGVPGSLVNLQPFALDDRLYTVDPDGRLTAFEVDTGERIWRRDLDIRATSGVGGGPGLLVVGGDERELLGIDPQTGETRWITDLTSTIYAPATVAGETVAARSNDGRLYVLDAETGDKRWADSRKVPSLSLHGSSRPVMIDGGVLVGMDNGKLALFNRQDGRLIWEVNVAQPSGRSALERMVDIDAAPLVDQGLIYALAYQGRLVAVDAARGQLVWAREMSGFADLALDAVRLYLTDERGHVWAVDRRNGASLWRQNALVGRSPTGPVVFGNYLVVGDYDGYLHWISREGGRIVGRLRVDSDAVGVQPLVIDGRLYALTDGGQLVAIENRPVKD